MEMSIDEVNQEKFEILHWLDRSYWNQMCPEVNDIQIWSNC